MWCDKFVSFVWYIDLKMRHHDDIIRMNEQFFFLVEIFIIYRSFVETNQNSFIASFKLNGENIYNILREKEKLWDCEIYSVLPIHQSSHFEIVSHLKNEYVFFFKFHCMYRCHFTIFLPISNFKWWFTSTR